jgi:hypothetical protein
MKLKKIFEFFFGKKKKEETLSLFNNNRRIRNRIAKPSIYTYR